MSGKGTPANFAEAEVDPRDAAAMAKLSKGAQPIELLTPEQWAHRKGLYVEHKMLGQESHFGWVHAAAKQLHGWKDHEHHAGEPIKLTEDAYDAALRTITHPDEDGQSRAHKPAMSPHCPHNGNHSKGR